MHSAAPIERRVCPENFQERINQVGGFNRYGEPNFKLVWAQTETTIQGGQWEVENELDYFRGYRRCYLGDGRPHWMLVQWVPAGKSLELPHLPPESPARWYDNNRCPVSGLSLLGPYPHLGSYQIALPLTATFMLDGKMVVRFFPLSTEIVNMMIPVIKASMKLSLEAKMRFMKEERDKDELEYAKAVDDVYNGIKLSKAAQTSKWIEDKVRSMEKVFNAALVTKMMRDRQFQSYTRI
jgi:hypothetical protein